MTKPVTAYVSGISAAESQTDAEYAQKQAEIELDAMRRVVDAACLRLQETERKWTTTRDDLVLALKRCNGPSDNLALPRLVTQASERLDALMKEHDERRGEFYVTRRALRRLLRDPEEN